MITVNDPHCIWYDFEQGTDEWLQARCGLLTASRMADAMDMKKSGGESEKRKNLCMEIVAERLTGKQAFVFQNGAMRWGTEQEPYAKLAYQEFTGRQITNCGLAVSRNIEFFGASPDGLIGDDGLIEIKCPTSQVFLQWVVDGEIPDQHKPQMLAQMAVTGRQWCDFVAFDPRFPSERDLFIRMYEPRHEDIAAVENAARQFLAEVAAMEQMFLKAKLF